MPDAPPDLDRRRGGFWNTARRLMVQHVHATVLTILATVTLVLMGFVRGVFAAPGKIEALKVQVDSMAAIQKRQGDDLKDVSEATWTFVALQCLSLTDSAFVSSRLPCGKAFQISGVLRRLAQ